MKEKHDFTPEKIYLNRKTFMKVSSMTALSALLNQYMPESDAELDAREMPDLTDEKYALHYNNYYEFSMDKEAPARLAKDFPMTPWTVQIGGLVKKEIKLDLDQIANLPAVNRVYRLRCVEGWAMTLPWTGIVLGEILKLAQPKPQAKFVRFETVEDRKRMPGLSDPWFDWPYVEGLRLDEAMHPLTIMGTGLYGKSLSPQNGGPIRLVVPWKYGFKSIKSVVKIDLVQEMPETFWMKSGPNEYGFYANVNPEVPHPRWSQASERVIGKWGRVKTLPFNGYEKEVAHLYEGMDLKKWF